MKSALAIRPLDVRFAELAGHPAHTVRSWEFYVDGVSFAQLLGIDRGSLLFCMCRLDDVRAPLRNNFLDQLLGAAPGWNQFGTEHISIYGCHCGCDYCGFVGIALSIEAQTVRWHSIRWEADEDDDPAFPDLTHADIVFDRGAYVREIDRFRALDGAPATQG